MASFVLRVGLRTCFAQPTAYLRSSTSTTLAVSKRNIGYLANTLPSNARMGNLRHTRHTLPMVLTATGIASAALGISSLTWTSHSTLHCDDVLPSNDNPPLPPPPKSSVNTYELAFGTVCGLCAGIFVKKSFYIAAYFLGGLFVVLQYLGSMSLIKVDWERMSSQFENLLYSTDALGRKRPPTVRSIWKWIVDFLTADFQPRASFVAGFALGVRVG